MNSLTAGYGFAALSVVFSTAMIAVFKEVERFKLDTLQVIAINYLTCVVIGALVSPSFYRAVIVEHPASLPVGILLGGLFMLNFIIIGATVPKLGMSFTAMLSKMSLVIPVTFSAIYYKDPFTWLSALGVLVALIAIVLINIRKKSSARSTAVSIGMVILLSAVLFIVSGITDSTFKFYSNEFGKVVDEYNFSIFVFGAAFGISAILIITKLVRGQLKWKWGNLAGGILLGIPNYLALVCFAKGIGILSGPTVFPITHIGTLLLASIIGLTIYKEKFTLLNYLGLAAAVFAILLLL